ncbi:MAG: aldo/keto reductase [Defluviitaleaceae bacterium]|nr:aldo/keto reductase [Defluviitaleaceae bacterium]
MNYRENPKNSDKLSLLGFGCMRFPKNEQETEELLLYAIENGINYFDTAYIYGNSEEVLGRILAKNNKRKDVKIATKTFPALIKKYSDFDKYFNRQLERLQTDYIDYYFIHMLTDVLMWQRLVDLGAIDWINSKKADGSIKNIGFSYHGGRDEFIKICDDFAWEFCMIQYNYLDEYKQAGKSGLQYANKKGLPVMIMEPLRGGRLANNLPKKALEAFFKADVQRTPAEWSFRWIYNHEEVTCVLSGMSDMKMLKENIAVVKSSKINSLTEAELLIIEEAKQAIEETIKVNCTGCNYCMPCPQGVDIPTCLSCYNNTVIEGRMPAIAKYFMQTCFKKEPSIASKCNKCGKCEKHCPQNIEIIKELENTKKALEKFYLKPIRWGARKFMKL